MDYGEADAHRDTPEPLPVIRSRFNRYDTTVFGWPSTGGLWYKVCSGLELRFLGLPLFATATTQRYSEEEDAFCKRFERIGARFFESELAFDEMGNREQQASDIVSWYGWPDAVPEGGGLWALWLGRYDDLPLRGGRLHNALSMQDRCNVIAMYGGRYYATWEDAMKDYGTKSEETKRLIKKGKETSEIFDRS